MKYAINVVSLLHLGWQWAKFPGCLFARPEQLINEAITVGYDGVQMIPVRGATGNENGILLWEKAWSAVNSLIGALTHQTGSEGAPSCFNYWVVSPNQWRCDRIESTLRRRGVQQICHSAEHVPVGCWVEVNPGNRLTAEQYISAMLSNNLGGFVIDTHHLQRAPQTQGQSPLLTAGEWGPVISVLAPLVKAVHLHPTDLGEFFANPVGSVEADIVRQLRQDGTNFDNLIMVAEYLPPKSAMLNPNKSNELAADILEAMKQIVSST